MITEFKNNLYLYFNFAYGIKDLILFSKSGKYICEKFQELDPGASSLEQKILNLYTSTDKELKTSNSSNAASIEISEFKPKKNEYSTYLTDIKSFINNHNLTRYADFIIFGSMASEDYVAEFSGTDIIMFLKDELFTSTKNVKWFKKRIHELNGLLLRIDPMQDHGLFIVLPNEMHNYDQSVNIPLTVLEKGFNLGNGDLKMTFALMNETKQNKNQILDNYISLSLKETNTVLNTVRFFRNLLHRAYLFPVFYLQANGKHCYKKNSFELIKDDKRFDIIGELSEYYNESYYQKRKHRVYPKLLFKKFPLLTRLILERIYGSKNQEFMTNAELRNNVIHFQSLLKNIKSHG